MARPFSSDSSVSDKHKTLSLYTNDMSGQGVPPVSQGWPLRINQRSTIDQRQSEYRQSKSYSQLEQLAQHPQRLAHLSIIMALLELDNLAWNCIQHIRKHESSAEALRMALPQLYQIPEDMAGQLEDIRAGSDWESVKEFVMRTVAEGGFSLSSRPNSQRLSGWSPRSSTNSTGSTRSNLSKVSTQTSDSSPLSLSTAQHMSIPVNPIEQTRDEIMHMTPSPSTNAVSSPQYLTPKQEKLYVCPLPGCRREFKTETWYNKHKKHEHEEYFSPEGWHPPQGENAPGLQVPYSEPSMNQSFNISAPAVQAALIVNNVTSLQPARRLVLQDRHTELPFTSSQIAGQNPYGQTGVNLMAADTAFLGAGQMLMSSMYGEDDGRYGDAIMADMGFGETAVHNSLIAAAEEASYNGSQVFRENHGYTPMGARR